MFNTDKENNDNIIEKPLNDYMDVQIYTTIYIG